MCPLRFYIKLLPVSDLDFSKTLMSLNLSFSSKMRVQKKQLILLETLLSRNILQKPGFYLSIATYIIPSRTIL